jgi:hypothetical protein
MVRLAIVHAPAHLFPVGLEALLATLCFVVLPFVLLSGLAGERRFFPLWQNLCSLVVRFRVGPRRCIVAATVVFAR